MGEKGVRAGAMLRKETKTPRRWLSAREVIKSPPRTASRPLPDANNPVDAFQDSQRHSPARRA